MSRRLCFTPDHDDDDSLPESLNVLDRNELAFLEDHDPTPEISEDARQ
jgi:hypothetical protein